MPRKLIYDTKEKQLEMMRKSSRKYYHEKNGRIYHRIRYLMRVNDITEDEVKDLETPQEKLEYCQVVHIKNKYGIRIADIDDNTTVATEITTMDA